MYIVVEGIKGTGKSTLIQNLNENFREAITVSPTRIFEECVLVDRIQKLVNNSSPNRILKEMLYVFKSNIASLTTDWSHPLILGDRSIITSYATRLWRFNQPSLQVGLIDIIEPFLPAPDIVLYLEPNLLDTVLQRLENRERSYGKEDETICKLKTDLKAYEYLRKHPTKRIENSKWIVIDANMSKEEILEESINIINQYK